MSVLCSDIIEGCGDEDGRRSIIEIDELGTCAEHVLGPVGPSTWSIRQIWASISGHHHNTWVGLFMVELGYLEPKEHLGTARSSRI